MTDQPSTDPTTTDPPTTPHCECINPFTETKPDKTHRGDPDTLCGPKGPGVCYVDCNADCRDIEPTASVLRLLLNLIDIFFQTCNDVIWNGFMFIFTLVYIFRCKSTLAC